MIGGGGDPETRKAWVNERVTCQMCVRMYLRVRWWKYHCGGCELKRDLVYCVKSTDKRLAQLNPVWVSIWPSALLVHVSVRYASGTREDGGKGW